MSSVGKINLDLNVNSKGFKKQVDSIGKTAKSSFGLMSVAVGNIVSNMITKALSSIGNFVKDSIDKGSELSELQNVVDSVFTTMADKVESFSKSALKTYGLTESQAKKMVGTYGAMSKSFGYTEKQAYSMSTALTGLTADVASFYNLNHDEAYTKMKSVFTGETESLKELGVVMTQAALDQFALSNGFGKTTNSMSEQEKVALRLAFVQDKLNVAAGDFSRTSSGWANQTRILAGQFESLKTAIGQGLISVLTPVIHIINTIMGKLVQLANAFASFMSMITGGKSGGKGVGKTMQGVAEAAANAAESTSDVAGAAGGAAKSAQKAQKALMGFDEINKLPEKSDSGGGGGGGGGSSLPEFDFSGESPASKSLEELKGKANELATILKNGFKDGLGKDFEASLQRTKAHLAGIKTSLSGIFTDPSVKASINNFVTSLTFALGQVAGSVVSIGQTICENLIGGFDTYLSQNSSYIKQRIAGIFNAKAEVAAKIGEITSTIAEIFEVFRTPEAKQMTGDLIGIFANSFLGSIQLAAQFGSDIVDTIATPLIDNKDKIKQALMNIITPIGTILNTLNTSVTNTFSKIFQVYEQYIKPTFDKFKTGISNIVSAFLDAFNTNIAPVLSSFASTFQTVWSSKIQPTIDKAIELIGKISLLVGTLWQNVISPFISWLISTIIPVVAPIIQTIGNTVMQVIGAISQVIGGVIDVLSGVITFLQGVFTGDWSTCWEGIKQIFSGFVGIIKGLVSGLISSIVGSVKAFFQTIVGIVKLIWNTIVGIFKTSVEIIKNVVKVTFEAIKSIITTIFNAVKTFVSTVWNGIKSVISTVVNAIKTTVTNVFNNIKTAVVNIFTGIKTKASSIFTSFKTTVTTTANNIKTAITSAFTNAYKGITGVFNKLPGFFSGIWGKVKTTFSNLGTKLSEAIGGAVKQGVNGLFSKVSSIVNGFIGAINGAISVINAIPGVSISKLSTISIPALAQGGYVKANQPQPVIVGDNKTQGEIISPEGKMFDVMTQALQSFFEKLMNVGYNKGNQVDAGDIVIPIYLDGTLLDEVIVTAQQRKNLRSGGK